MSQNTLLRRYEIVFNSLELLAVALVLLMAFILQLVLHELPCPLCLLQRVGFLGVAFGFMLNLRFGLRPSHYGIVLLSALFTSFIALRQISLHVIPGTGTYGDAFMGLHLYTWCFMVAMLIVISTTLLFSVDRQYQYAHRKNLRWSKLTYGLFILTALLTVFNIVSLLLECGLQACPDNPIHYVWLLR
jgi:disulfide bond formation protein DsbB